MINKKILPEKPNDLKESTKTRTIQNITFFGDSAIEENHPEYKRVYESAKLLVKNNFRIVNGGGPGLMKASTDGAEEVNGETILVYWEPKLASIFEGKNLANVGDYSYAESNYVNRTFGLIEQGDAFVVCKGGTGTISEFGLVWALAKMYFGVHKPVILFGGFWKEIIDSFVKNMYIDEDELGVLYFASTPEELLNILLDHERKLDRTKLKNVTGSESAFLLGNRTKNTFDALNKTDNRTNKIEGISKEYLDKFISLVKSPAQVLDLGCGKGSDSSYLSEKYSVTAIEIVPRLAEIAKFKNPNVNIILGDLIEYKFDLNKYKGVWSRDALHFIEDEYLESVFKKIYETLVEGGVFGVVVRKGNSNFIDEKTGKYYNPYSPEKLIHLSESVGFKLESLNHLDNNEKRLFGVFKR